MSVRKRVASRGGSSGVTGIHTPPLHGIIIKISREIAQCGGWQLDGSDIEYEEDVETLTMNVADPGVGGGEHVCLWNVLQ